MADDVKRDKSGPGPSDFLSRYVATIIAATVCLGLAISVGQIRYAYDPRGFGDTLAGSYLLISIFCCFFIISAIGIFRGERLFQEKWAARKVGDGDETGYRMRLRYIPFIGVVTWANGMLYALQKLNLRAPVGVLLAILGVVTFIAGRRGADVPFEYPLSAYFIINAVAVPCMILGVWIFLARPNRWPSPGNKPAFGQVIGWHLGWIVSSLWIQEIIWYVATLQLSPTFGYLMYSQWAIAHVLFLVVVAAHLLDYIDSGTRWPVRFIGLIAAAYLSLQILDPIEIRHGQNSREVGRNEVAQQSEAGSRQRLLGGETSDDGDDFLSEGDLWIKRLKQRIDNVNQGPCILVAASGGGSRASIFASLVLRGLAHQSGFGSETFADQVVLISSVSGGGLGASQTIHEGFERRFTGSNPAHRNNDLKELKAFTRQAIEREITELKRRHDNASEGTQRPVSDQRGMTEEQQLAEAIGLRLTSAEGLKGDLDQYFSDNSWVTSDPVIDKVSLDFMAPIFRGALTIGPSRGEALRNFWDQQFGWKKVSNTNAYLDQETPPPLHFLNACMTSWGTRYVLGYPALPPKFFTRRMEGKLQTRFPIRSLADEANNDSEMVSLPLSHAVRLTSNFPWGFRVRRLANKNLLDGGMVDNTGIDTIYEILRRLNESKTGRSVLQQMARKGVLMLEIDSGGKPSGREDTQSEAAGLIEPIATFGKVIHTNSDIIKEYYLKEIESMLRQAVVESHFASVATRDREAEVVEAIEKAALFGKVQFQCESFLGSEDSPASDESTVMTAWALDARQKGIVIARYLVELEVFKEKMREMRSGLEEVYKMMPIIDQTLESLSQVEGFGNVEAQQYYRSEIKRSVKDVGDKIQRLNDQLKMKQAVSDEEFNR